MGRRLAAARRKYREAVVKYNAAPTHANQALLEEARRVWLELLAQWKWAAP